MKITESARRSLAKLCVAALTISLCPMIQGSDFASSSEQTGMSCGCSTEYPEESWCENACCGCCWTLTADALFLTRSSPEAIDLIFANVAGNPGPPLFNARQLDGDVAVGPRVSLFRDCGCEGLEFTVFGIDRWTTVGSVNGPVHVAFPGFLQPLIPGGVGPGTATYINDSSLFSIELNATRRQNDWLTLLAGIRWLEVGDDLLFQFTPNGGATANFFVTDVNNHLYGGQIGALANLSDNGLWRLDSWLKAGVYYNSADQSTNVFFPAVASVSDRGDKTSFVGDVGLVATRQLSDQLALRLGYQMLWIEGIALAPDQLNGILDITVPIAVIDINSGVFYHGGFAGLEYTF